MDKLCVKFPDDVEYEFESGKPIVLLGANGAGKTRLSVKIEELNDPTYNLSNTENTMPIHRLSAQKSLSIQDSISILDNESAKNDLFLGSVSLQSSKRVYRYSQNPATIMLNDFNKALSLLFSEENKELQLAHKADKQAIEEGVARPDPITTVVEKATDIWNELLPHRAIDLTENGVHVKYNGQRYHGKEMSDGERVMLYMISQVLVQRPNTLLIIDEPELHIHKTILDRMWTRLESERKDCVFMYITHDLNFALSRISARILWVRSYDGIQWDYEFLNSADYENLPASLLYELIGTRKKVLFVEGTKNSYDYYLYQEIYGDKGYHIIPCGSCKDVIRLVKAKNTYEKLGSIEVHGIIDRDFRTDNEITALEKDGIHCLKVAEVENLFVVPELLDIMEDALLSDKGSASKAKELIKKIYSVNIEKQTMLALTKEMKFQLSILDIGKEKMTPEGIKSTIDNFCSIDMIERILSEKKRIFNEADTVEKILVVFNFKNMSKIVGNFFGVNNPEYPEKVLNLLRSNNDERASALNAISKYTPELT